MAKIHTAGETVFDIMFENGVPTGGNPGGSVLNSSVTLGRLGLKPRFLTDFCSDMLGDNIKTFLTNNGVEPVCVIDDHGMKTSVALAFLDEHKNARYQFYKSRPAKCHEELFKSDFERDDIFLFGSFYGIMPEIRPGMRRLIHDANNKGVVIVYDPNFRKPHLSDLPKVMPFIKENIEAAAIVKGSDEDFELIFGAKDFDTAAKEILKINPGATLFYTMGAKGSLCLQAGRITECAAPPITPVSTIGAGDNYNAGIVYGIAKHHITLDNLKEGINNDIVLDIMRTATKFAQEVCMSSSNYISL